jgi:hypothetical protein
VTEFITDVNPPEWCDFILWLFLKPEDRDSVSGDLLEEYREMIRAGRDRAAADRWYLRQMTGFLWRSTWAWAAILSALWVGRGVLDALVPPASYHMRSLFSTWSAVAIFTILGFRGAWRGRSVAGSVPESLANSVAAVVSTQITANLMNVAGILVFLAIWHDPQTRTAKAQSGGLGEAFFLPVFITFPAAGLAILGGTAALLLPRPRQV